MKVLINTFGTRGDIQPFVALAMGLEQAGHRATICTAEGFRPFIEEHGVAYAHMDNHLYELINAQEGKELLEGKGNAFALYKQVGPMMQQMMVDEWAAAQAVQPDFILYHPKALGSYHIAEKLNLPLAMALPLPMYTPTSAFPVPMFGTGIRLGGWYNHLLQLIRSWSGFRPETDEIKNSMALVDFLRTRVSGFDIVELMRSICRFLPKLK